MITVKKILASNKRMLVIALAVAFVLTLGAGTAWAYYTDSVRSDGAVPVAAPPTTDITEEMDSNSKLVTITNTGEISTLVRVKVFCASNNATVAFSTPVSPARWLATDEAAGDDESGWLYYNAVLAPGESTDVLRIDVTPLDGAADEFDVVVVQQCASKVISREMPLVGQFGEREVTVQGTEVASLFVGN